MANQSPSGYQTPSGPAARYDDAYFGGEGSGSYDEGEQEFIRLQIDVRDLLEDFEHRVLRGEYEYVDHKSGSKMWKRYDLNIPPMINENGIRTILARLIGKVSKAAKLTWKTDEEIYKDMFYFDMSITELIAKKVDEWELDVETAKSIKDACVELVWDIVASSRNGFTAINLRSQYSRQDVTRQDSTAKEGGKSFLGIPLGRK